MLQYLLALELWQAVGGVGCQWLFVAGFLRLRSRGTKAWWSVVQLNRSRGPDGVLEIREAYDYTLKRVG